MKDTTIAVDIAKNVFEIAVSFEVGKAREHHRVTRGKFLSFFAKRGSATVVMEACGSAHHWAREIEKLGHRVVLLPLMRYVRMSSATKPTEPTRKGYSKRIGTKTSTRCR